MKARAPEAGESSSPSMTEFLLQLEKSKPFLLSNWNLYTINDRIVADEVTLYESINEGLAELADYLSVPAGSLSLPKARAKGGYREDDRPYWQVLTETDKEIIARVCRKEIIAFGYSF